MGPQQGLADLRPWFKTHGLARQEIKVVVIDRKKEIAVVKSGDDFLFGDRLPPGFPLELFQIKWGRRFEQQPDDWSAAPGKWSGYAGKGVEDNRIPWAALKSAWRRSAGSVCLNCDTAPLFVNFGNP